MLQKRDSLLRKLVHGYLQEADVSYHGYIYHLLHAKSRTKKGEYRNSLWHWDGCGTRLKAYVYLLDVGTPEEGGRPTKIIGGT